MEARSETPITVGENEFEVMMRALLESQPWNNASCRPAVLLVFPAESTCHEALFNAALHGEADPQQHHGDGTAKLPETDGRADEGQNHARVDGMTDPAIGPRANELMSDLNGHSAAPISAEVSPGPNGEQQSACGNRDSPVCDPGIAWQNAQPHPAECRIMAEHGIKGGECEDHVRHSGPEALSRLCALGGDGPQQPDHEEGRPEIPANAHCAHRQRSDREYDSARQKVPERRSGLLLDVGEQVGLSLRSNDRRSQRQECNSHIT